MRQIADDRQTQSGAALLSRVRAVELRKWLKQQRLFRRCDANSSVCYRKLDARCVGVILDFDTRDLDFAAFGELDRIADQVHQHLS